MRNKNSFSIGILLIRLTLACVYLWFGYVKLCGHCDLELLIQKTLPWMPETLLLPTLGLGEVLIGLMFLFPQYIKLTLLMFFGHMVGTFLPLVLLPEMTGHGTLFFPTATGQYIIKNIVFLACGVVLFEHYILKKNRPATVSQ